MPLFLPEGREGRIGTGFLASEDTLASVSSTHSGQMEEFTGETCCFRECVCCSCG